MLYILLAVRSYSQGIRIWENSRQTASKSCPISYIDDNDNDCKEMLSACLQTCTNHSKRVLFAPRTFRQARDGGTEYE